MKDVVGDLQKYACSGYGVAECLIEMRLFACLEGAQLISQVIPGL